MKRLPGALLRPFFALAACLLAGEAVAQEQVTFTFTNIQQVLALGRQVSRDSNFTARVAGVVTYTAPGHRYFCIQEGTNALIVIGPRLSLAPGMVVHAEGSVAPGDLVPFLEDARVDIVGDGPVPAPVPARFQDLRSGVHHGRHVSIQAVVRDMTLSGGTLTMLLSRREQTFQAQSPVPPGFKLPRAWMNATIELRGICWTSADVYGQGYGFTLHAMNTNAVRVLRAGGTNIFDLPLLSLKEARLALTNRSARIRLEGVVTQFSPLFREFYIELEDTPVLCEPLKPLRRNNTPGEFIPLFSPALQPGDHVEVVGIPQRIGGLLQLQLSEWRRVQAGTPPVPVATTPRDLLRGKLWHRVVQVKGRVINRTTARSGPILIEQVFLEGDGLLFTATGDLPPGALKINKDGYAEVTGVAISQMRQWDPPHTFMLRLRDGNDIRLIPGPRWWQRAEARRTAAIAGGVSLMAALWILLQRRQVLRLRLANHERRAAEQELRELNARLEEHVLERTRELADANSKLRHEVVRRELAQADLRIALDAEKELSQLKGMFVSMVSHEFRTPLEVILSSSNILDRYLDRLPPDKRKTQLRAIRKSVHRMNDLIEDVLVLGKLEAGRLACSSTPIDLEAVCRRAVAEIESAAGRDGAISFRTEHFQGEAIGDESLLSHILINLLGNALKYSPPGAVVECRASRQGNDAELVIRDHGCGIPAADQARLFTQFYRGSNVGHTPGSGLGLVIVKRCVDLHGGTIKCQSVEGQGTTFTVRLPLFDEARLRRPRMESGMPANETLK